MWFQVFSNVLIHPIFKFTKEKRTKKEKVIIVVLLIRITKYKTKGLNVSGNFIINRINITNGLRTTTGLTFEQYLTFNKMLTILIGVVLFLIFIFLSAIHFYWGLGGQWGANAAIPTKENSEKVINPKLFECFIVAFGLLGFGLFILVKSQILSFELPNWLLKYGVWALSLLFILRAIGEFKYIGFFKKIKSTRFGQLDTKYYSPLCLAIGLFVMILALTT